MTISNRWLFLLSHPLTPELIKYIQRLPVRYPELFSGYEKEYFTGITSHEVITMQ